MNPILATDSYKASHYLQDPPGTTAKFSYIEARRTTGPLNYTLFYGLTPIIQDYLVNRPIIASDIERAEKLMKMHGVPFNRAGFERILLKHRGYMPVRIKCVPEGSIVPNGNALVTVETTDPELPWVASYLETLLLRVWYPTTVATRSHAAKQVIRRSMLRTCDNLDGLPFKLHDFGARGVSSGESAKLGGLAHLVNFHGTDTMEALVGGQEYYGEACLGYSIPAAEHSTITAWGREGEADAYRNMLKQFGNPGSVLAVVSDSYDIYNAVDKIWGQELRDEVIKSGATVVIRPDSGVPTYVVPAILNSLEARFGSVTNQRGYKVLNHVRVIQGDGIDSPESIDRILQETERHGFSTDNLAFGMGGGLLQKCDRDTLSFAMKCSAAKVDGEWRDVYKDPVTDKGKQSKRGLLTLEWRKGSGYKTSPIREGQTSAFDAMETIYECFNGRASFEPFDNFPEIRERANASTVN